MARPTSPPSPPDVPDGHDPLATYLGIVGHELRTPLSVIQTAAETLDLHGEALGADDRAQLTASILRNVRRATALLARLEAAHANAESEFAVTPEVFDLVSLVTTMTEDLRGVVLLRHPTTVAPSSPILVHADPNAVGEIIENVLTNAAKYSTDDASIEITITRTDHGVAELAVRDHGAGIDDETATRIFEPHQRGTSDVVGEGLGLYLSRELARSSGGDVVLRSHGPSGCTFVVTLPAADQP